MLMHVTFILIYVDRMHLIFSKYMYKQPENVPNFSRNFYLKFEQGTKKIEWDAYFKIFYQTIRLFRNIWDINVLKYSASLLRRRNKVWNSSIRRWRRTFPCILNFKNCHIYQRKCIRSHFIIRMQWSIESTFCAN